MPEHNSAAIKMSRSIKKYSEKVKEKVDFRLQFHATRLPQTGWDRLVVSLIPADTGRTSSKTQKAYVRNGNCQWPDAVIESTMLSADPKSKEYEEKLYRIVVSMALSRTGVLGEVTVNLADYVAANSPNAVALPLKNCSYGTVLHIKIQCLTPIASSREAETQREAGLEYADDSSEIDDDSDVLGNQQHNGSHIYLKDTDVLESTLRNSSDLSEVSLFSRSRGSNGNNRVSVSGDSSSPTSSVGSLSDRQEQSGKIRSGSQDLNTSFSSPQKTGRSLATAPLKNQNSNKKTDQVNLSATIDGVSEEDSPFNTSQGPFQNTIRATNTKATAYADQGYFRTDLDAVERTIEEQCLEAKKWETHAQKCSTEVETLKQQLSEQIKQVADRSAEMSALLAERDSINAELQQLKYEKQVLEDKGNGDDSNRWEAEDSKSMVKELKEEIAFQKETNLNLNLQLRKIQDSNMELVSAVQELEESLEEQHKEMEELLIKNGKLETSIQEASYQQQHSQTAVERDLTAKTQSLEEHIKVLQMKISAYESNHSSLPSSQPAVEKLMKEIEELERDTKELTDENMELIFNLNKTKQQLASKNVTVDQLEAELKRLSSTQFSGTTLNADILVAADELDGLTSLTMQDVHFKSLKEGDLESEQEKTRVQLVTHLKADMENIERENASLLQEKAEMEYLINNLQEQKAESTEQLRKVENDRDTAIAKVHKLEEEITALLQQATAHSLEVQDLFSKVTQAEKAKADLESKLHDSQERERLNMSRFEKLALQLSIFAEETESTILSKKDLEAVIAQAERGKNALQQALEISQEECTSAKIYADNLTKDLVALRAQMDLHVQARADLEKSFDQMEVTKNDLQDQLAGLEIKNSQLSETNKRLEQHMRIVTEDRETFRSGKDSMESLISELRKEKEEREIKHQTFVKEHELKLFEVERKKMEAEKECDMHKEANRHLEIQFEKLQSQVVGQEEVRRSLEERANVLQRLNTEMEESALSLKKDHSAGIAEKISLHSEMDYLKRSFDDKEKKYAEELEALKSSRIVEERRTASAIEQLQNEVQQLTEQLGGTTDMTEGFALRGIIEASELGAERTERDNNSGQIENKVGHLSSSNGMVGLLSSSSQSLANFELTHLRENVKLLEDKIRLKALELDTLKREFSEKEMVLCEKIDYLEMANEQLAEGQDDSGLEQLQNELTRLQNHNALLLRREQELLLKLSTQELLQSEMQRLQEDNEQLDCKLSKLLETMDSGNPLERIVQLETELADALEANNMYKTQLQSAFAQQHNVHAAALQNLGNVDQVIADLMAFKKQTVALEEDLKEMRDRYFSMSLKYAEVEAEREELVFTVRTLRNGQKR
ncbi:hypothetical protein O6H91_05G119200 [Diphasiastrum complanatum]|nr:hypothetical protein O6H91_05G119200 [Diphasiastrum complanatum]